MDSWDGLHRQGQDFLNRLLGSILQGHLRGHGIRVGDSLLEADHGLHVDASRLPFVGPWMKKSSQVNAQGSSGGVRVSGDRRNCLLVDRGRVEETEQIGGEGNSGIQLLGKRLGQAGAGIRACLGGIVRHLAQSFPWLLRGGSDALPWQQPADSASSGVVHFREGYIQWREVDESTIRENKGRGSRGGVRQNQINSKRGGAEEATQPQQEFNKIQHASNEELFAKSRGELNKQGRLSAVTTFDSRTQKVQSTVVARGNLWRVEALQGASRSTNGASPTFRLQIGPFLLARDTRVLLPVHLSKQHVLWYGFDWKNGLHSLCPAIWSKHRRWWLMSMICLNPLTCPFLDMQFPNGQVTYVAGEGLTGNACFLAFGGLIQSQCRWPGSSALSFSRKMKWGMRITPSVQLLEKSLSLELMQPLSWQCSGLVVRPTVQLSATPTFGGRNAGWKAEAAFLPKENLSCAIGCAMTIQPCAFATLSLGRSERNGGSSASLGLVIRAESPLENLNRASFNIQLNSELEL